MKMANMKKNRNILQITRAAIFLSISLVLPFATGQIPQIGKLICPMHFPVILCGFFCGPEYGILVGLTAPILRFAFFGMPVIVPTGVIMSLELATYGLVVGLCYRFFPRYRAFIYLDIILAMVAGRIVWGVMHMFFSLIEKSEFSWILFISGSFLNAIPGIVFQLIVIPLIVIKFGNYFKGNTVC